MCWREVVRNNFTNLPDKPVQQKIQKKTAQEEEQTSVFIWFWKRGFRWSYFGGDMPKQNGPAVGSAALGRD